MAPAGFAGAYLTPEFAHADPRCQSTPGNASDRARFSRGGGKRASLVSKIRLGRSSRYHDWQQDLAAPSAESRMLVPVGESAPAVRRASPTVWAARALIPALLGIYILLAVGPSGSYVSVAAVVLGPSIVGPLLRAVLTRLRARSDRHMAELAGRQQAAGEELDPAHERELRRLLDKCTVELRGFVDSPPTRRRYQRWVRSREDRLARVWPELAGDWARRDLNDTNSGVTVSRAELEARGERITELYGLVATRASRAAQGEPVS